MTTGSRAAPVLLEAAASDPGSAAGDAAVVLVAALHAAVAEASVGARAAGDAHSTAAAANAEQANVVRAEMGNASQHAQ